MMLQTLVYGAWEDVTTLEPVVPTTTLLVVFRDGTVETFADEFERLKYRGDEEVVYRRLLNTTNVLEILREQIAEEQRCLTMEALPSPRAALPSPMAAGYVR